MLGGGGRASPRIFASRGSQLSVARNNAAAGSAVRRQWGGGGREKRVEAMGGWRERRRRMMIRRSGIGGGGRLFLLLASVVSEANSALAHLYMCLQFSPARPEHASCTHKMQGTNS